MNLIVPYLDQPNPDDVRLIRLATLSGVPCTLLPLKGAADVNGGSLNDVFDHDASCLVVNASVMKKWVSREVFPPGLEAYIAARFRFLFVHNLDDGRFSASLLNRLSRGRLRSLHTPRELPYRIAAERDAITDVFSGLEFGRANEVHDRVFDGALADPSLRVLISVDGLPLFASVARDGTELFFSAVRHIVDISVEVDCFAPLEHFSRVVPPMMFFRHAFRSDCWRPNINHATLIIDDPLLRNTYGFLNYDRLLTAMDKYGFHTSIAFIPYNASRTSPNIARLLADRADRYSLCVHGNNHSGREFATTNVAILNTEAQQALRRMDTHRSRMGIRYDRVMVFPQGIFSQNAMRVLRANNFVAAVNSHPYPVDAARQLELADYLRPAITRHGGFPLYLRKYVRELTTLDAAFNLFFGKPIFIVEHHTVFRNPDLVVEVVSRVNSLSSKIMWTNLDTAIENSFLHRQHAGVRELLTYAGRLRVTKTQVGADKCLVIKPETSEARLRRVVLNQMPLGNYAVTHGSLEVSLTVTDDALYSIDYHNDFPLTTSRTHIQPFALFWRRRLSEIRDNHFSKSPTLLSMLQRVQQCICGSSRTGLENSAPEPHSH